MSDRQIANIRFNMFYLKMLKNFIAASEDDGELARVSSERRRNIVSSYIFKKIIAAILMFFPFKIFAASGIVSEIPNPLGDGTTISRVVANVTDFILTAGIAISVIVFLIAGFQYLFSFGSEQKVGQARKTMTYGAIGALVLLLGKGITQLIISIIG